MIPRIISSVCVAAALAVSASFAAEHETGGFGRPLPPGWQPAVHDSEIHYLVLLDRAEFRTGELPDAVVLDASGWIGGDYHRFAWRLEAEQLADSPKAGEVEAQALYSRTFAAFWNLQAGVRLDRAYSGLERETRGHAVLGIEGTAPYGIELWSAVFLNDDGDLSFSFEASYQLLITQRLVLEPSVGIRLDSADAPESGSLIAEGVNDLDVGVRLRYDISRQFSPYIGVEWHRALGESAGAARRLNADLTRTAFVLGARVWF